MEMLEAVLMRTFLKLYKTDFEAADDDKSGRVGLPGRTSSSERRAFTLLASVCSCWYYTLTGYPHSPTGLWVQHQLKRLMDGLSSMCDTYQIVSHMSM